MIANYTNKVRSEGCVCSSCLDFDDSSLFIDSYINQRLSFDSDQSAVEQKPVKVLNWLVVGGERKENLTRTFASEPVLDGCIPVGLSRMEQDWLDSLS